MRFAGFMSTAKEGNAVRQVDNYFQPIHLQPFYRERFGYKEGYFPVTEGISSRTIALPFYNNLTEKEIDYVVSNLDDILNTYR